MSIVILHHTLRLLILATFQFDFLLSAMRSSGLAFFKENLDPLNTCVFSADTETGVLIMTGASALSRLFKCSEPQKEVTPEGLTTLCSSTSPPMHRQMVSNNLPPHPTAHHTMDKIAIYRFISSE